MQIPSLGEKTIKIVLKYLKKRSSLLNMEFKFSGPNAGNYANKLPALIEEVEAKRTIIAACNFHTDKSKFIDGLIADYAISDFIVLDGFIIKVKNWLEKDPKELLFRILAECSISALQMKWLLHPKRIIFSLLSFH